ncbi:hypothetical protein ONS96_001585 [Cadophora gregata f. sp. sojae]|nr:hypothetical protein ONS96_001585 [Cadophora gregata f. sp. sojae]
MARVSQISKNASRGTVLSYIYIDNVKRSLARHGFTRLVELNKDPERQDKLTTWIEFLDFEHWHYDKDARIVKRLQPKYDAAWKKLVDSQVLKPHETEEVIRNMASVFQHVCGTQLTEKAVASAEAAVLSAQHLITVSRRSNLPQREPQRQLARAQTRLDRAAKSLESMTRRNNLIAEFYRKAQLSQRCKDGYYKKSLQEAKEDAKRRGVLIHWILQQIPVIEMELEGAKVAGNDSNTVHGESRCDVTAQPSEEQRSEKQIRKRSRQDDTVDDESPSKRPRYDVQPSSSAARKIPSAADKLVTGLSQKSRTVALRSSKSE